MLVAALFLLARWLAGCSHYVYVIAMPAYVPPMLLEDDDDDDDYDVLRRRASVSLKCSLNWIFSAHRKKFKASI